MGRDNDRSNTQRTASRCGGCDGIRRLARREVSIRRSVGLPYAVERATACRGIE